MQKIKIQSTAIPQNWIAKPGKDHYSFLQWLVNLQQFQFFIHKTNGKDRL